MDHPGDVQERTTHARKKILAVTPGDVNEPSAKQTAAFTTKNK